MEWADDGDSTCSGWLWNRCNRNHATKLLFADG